MRLASSLAVALALAATPAAAAPRPAVVVAAGDIACDPGDPAFHGGAGTAELCRMRDTSDQALALDPAAVLVLGDNQYWSGTLDQHLASYHPTWGRLRSRTLPVPGNHEYLTPGAAGYFAYFGAAAGSPSAPWNAWRLGPETGDGPAWLALGLDSTCRVAGECAAQRDWLEERLAAPAARCVLAFWHHPRFSSGLHGDEPRMAALWAPLRAAEADLVLTGHDHHYERFAPMDEDGQADPRGPRQFVVGTGGSRLYPIPRVEPNSERRIAGAYGVLSLTLYAEGYAWRFLPLDGGPGDAGAALCHAAWPAPTLWHPLPRCRAVATRRAPGPLGGPALDDGGSRDFAVGGSCGVPADAVAITGEVKTLAASRRGTLRISPAGEPAPALPTVDFWRRGVFTMPILLRLGDGGALRVETAVAGAGSVHMILDVTGYFR